MGGARRDEKDIQILIGKSEEEMSPGSPNLRWQDNIKLILN
jgi:hypothetical protein